MAADLNGRLFNITARSPTAHSSPAVPPLQRRQRSGGDSLPFPAEPVGIGISSARCLGPELAGWPRGAARGGPRTLVCRSAQLSSGRAASDTSLSPDEIKPQVGAAGAANSRLPSAAASAAQTEGPPNAYLRTFNAPAFQAPAWIWQPLLDAHKSHPCLHSLAAANPLRARCGPPPRCWAPPFISSCWWCRSWACTPTWAPHG